VEKSYSGVFYILFDDKTSIRVPWNSRVGIYSVGLPELSYENVETILSNINFKTDETGVISYSPVGPKLVATYSDPRVIYLGLIETFPEAISIFYVGSRESEEDWKTFISAISEGFDENGNPIVS
jgi:hypothetical protein